MLIGCIQVGEFLLIIGFIKWMQWIYGWVFIVFGVIVVFWCQVLVDVGYWSLDMIIEDIDISWKFQFCYWDIFFEL